MEIIEQQVVGKHTADDCEDGIVITPDFVAVIDGSTSKSPLRISPEMRNGRFCMLQLCKVIPDVPAEATLDDLCDRVTAAIAPFYDRPLPPRHRLCASMVIYSRYHHTIWLIGDCQCMVGGQLYENSKPDEAKIARRRAELFPEMCRQHPDMLAGSQLVHDYARDAVLPQLIESMQGQNKSYAVIDGTPIYRPGIREVKLMPGQHEVVLATDGYPLLHSTLAESEQNLQHQLETDPYNIRCFVATKGLMQGNLSFDDRAYVRFVTS